MGLLDRLFGHPEKDDQTEIELAIHHNEARGDPVPDEWYLAAEQGIAEFGSDAEQALWRSAADWEAERAAELPTLEGGDKQGGWW